MEDIFGKRPMPGVFVCHSGGAAGADTAFEEIGAEFGVETRAYSWRTKSHRSPNKVEISTEDYEQGVAEVFAANRILGRFGIRKYMSLLARNWAQVKYSRQVFAVGRILAPGERSHKGYANSSGRELVDGGTGYAVTMAILHQREVFVFDQRREGWFRWSYVSESFRPVADTPAITERDFAGIGTRELSERGEMAIRELYEKTFSLNDI